MSLITLSDMYAYLNKTLRVEIELRSRGLTHRRIFESYLDVCLAENAAELKKEKNDLTPVVRIDKNYNWSD